MSAAAPCLLGKVLQECRPRVLACLCVCEGGW